MTYSESSLKDLLRLRSEAATVLEHIDAILAIVAPNYTSDPAAKAASNSAAEPRKTSLTEQVRQALMPVAVEFAEAGIAMQEIMERLLALGVIKDMDRSTYNQVSVIISKADWAERIARGKYLLRPEPETEA